MRRSYSTVPTVGPVGPTVAGGTLQRSHTVIQSQRTTPYFLPVRMYTQFVVIVLQFVRKHTTYVLVLGVARSSYIYAPVGVYVSVERLNFTRIKSTCPGTQQ